jgi:uncharacterized protein YodC (DUF2158 family)
VAAFLEPWCAERAKERLRLLSGSRSNPDGSKPKRRVVAKMPQPDTESGKARDQIVRTLRGNRQYVPDPLAIVLARNSAACCTGHTSTKGKAMPEKRYKVGDRVTLKSGGLVMTVTALRGDSILDAIRTPFDPSPEPKTVECEWFDKTRHKSHWFDPKALKAAKAKP